MPSRLGFGSEANGSGEPSSARWTSAGVEQQQGAVADHPDPHGPAVVAVAYPAQQSDGLAVDVGPRRRRHRGPAAAEDALERVGDDDQRVEAGVL